MVEEKNVSKGIELFVMERVQTMLCYCVYTYVALYRVDNRSRSDVTLQLINCQTCSCTNVKTRVLALARAFPYCMPIISRCVVYSVVLLKVK